MKTNGREEGGKKKGSREGEREGGKEERKGGTLLSTTQNNHLNYFNILINFILLFISVCIKKYQMIYAPFPTFLKLVIYPDHFSHY